MSAIITTAERSSHTGRCSFIDNDELGYKRGQLDVPIRRNMTTEMIVSPVSGFLQFVDI